VTAFNVVRFRVKPGLEELFVARQRAAGGDMAGFRRGVLVKTGDRAYCMVGEWRSMSDIVNARPQMIAILDGIRDLLEDLGSGQGVTDPVSGEAVVEINPPKAARRRRKKAKPKKAAARRTVGKARNKRAKRK
jgi:hypothetical protein